MLADPTEETPSPLYATLKYLEAEKFLSIGDSCMDPLIYQSKLKTKTPRINSLQALRAIAFIAVFTYHCGVTPMGPWAVSVFFVLSGFCMYYAYSERTLPAGIGEKILFAKSKIKKIYPLHIFIVILLILIECLEQRHFNLNWLRILLDAFLLTSWLPPYLNLAPYNGVVWFLSTLTFLYLIFPDLVKIIKKFKNIYSIVISILVIYGLQILAIACVNSFDCISKDSAKWFAYIFPPVRVADFSIGCLVADLYMNVHDQVKSKFRYSIYELGTAIILLVILLVYSLKRGFWGSPAIRCTALFTLISAYIVFLFALNKGVFTMLLTNKFFLYIASISMYGFLIHQIIIGWVKTALFGTGAWRGFQDKIIVCILAFPITIILSELYRRIALLTGKHSSKNG